MCVCGGGGGWKFYIGASTLIYFTVSVTYAITEIF